MYWFRSRSRLSSCIALFALALQLVLTFGHVHLDGTAAHASATIEAFGGSAPSPAGNDKPDVAHDYCALCALVHLSGALVLNEPPSLPLLVVLWRRQRVSAPDFVSVSPITAAFAARAPPVG
jgi:hypothetical protein